MLAESGVRSPVCFAELVALCSVYVRMYHICTRIATWSARTESRHRPMARWIKKRTWSGKLPQLSNDSSADITSKPAAEKAIKFMVIANASFQGVHVADKTKSAKNNGRANTKYAWPRLYECISPGEPSPDHHMNVSPMTNKATRPLPV